VVVAEAKDSRFKQFNTYYYESQHPTIFFPHQKSSDTQGAKLFVEERRTLINWFGVYGVFALYAVFLRFFVFFFPIYFFVSFTFFFFFIMCYKQNGMSEITVNVHAKKHGIPCPR